jgi:putative transposase
MARPLRIQYDGALYHVTSRGNERKNVFKDISDRTLFLDILSKVNKRYNWLCHCYCLMDNHYHAVIETLDGNLSEGMRQLNGIYTQTFNKRHNRVGHVFQGRYKSILIQKESHLLEVCRYVVLNPVRAGAVKAPKEWEWSSYRATVGINKGHSCLTREWILGQFGNKRREAERRYREFVEAGRRAKRIWEKVRHQSILGEEDFAEALKGYVKGYEEVDEIPRRQRFMNRESLHMIFGDAIVSKRERNEKIRAANHEHGYNQKEIADYLGMHYSTISRLIGNKSKKRAN